MAIYEDFFNYDFIESLSLKNIDTPVRLDMTTWNKDFLILSMWFGLSNLHREPGTTVINSRDRKNAIEFHCE